MSEETIISNIMRFTDFLFKSVPFLSDDQSSFFFNQLRDLHRKRRVLSEPVKVVLAGNFSSGKSLFLNSLLGDEVVPFGDEPMTMIPSMFYYGSDSYIELEYKDRWKEVIDMETYLHLKHTTKNLVEKIEVERIKNVNFYYGSPLLKEYTLIDTPGFSTAVEKGDDVITESIILTHADVLIWISDINSGELSKSELNIIEKLKSLKEEMVLICLLNKCDSKGKPTGRKVQSITDKVRSQLKTNRVFPFSSQKLLSYRKQNCQINQALQEMIHKSNEKVTLSIIPLRNSSKLILTDSYNSILREQEIGDYSEWQQPLTQLVDNLKISADIIRENQKHKINNEISAMESSLKRMLAEKKNELNTEGKSRYQGYIAFCSEIALIQDSIIDNFENAYQRFFDTTKKGLKNICKDYYEVKNNGFFDDRKRIEVKKKMDWLDVEKRIKQDMDKNLHPIYSHVNHGREILDSHLTIVSSSSVPHIEMILTRLIGIEKNRKYLFRDEISYKIFNSFLNTIREKYKDTYESYFSNSRVYETLAEKIIQNSNCKADMENLKGIYLRSWEQIREMIKEFTIKEEEDLYRQVSLIEKIIKS